MINKKISFVSAKYQKSATENKHRGTSRNRFAPLAR